jgi:hypothetical protein
MILELDEEEAATLARLLRQTIDVDRYPLSPRITAVKTILGKIRPEPPYTAPLPPVKHYMPPRIGARRRR